jgi:hypothetical protein
VLMSAGVNLRNGGGKEANACRRMPAERSLVEGAATTPNGWRNVVHRLRRVGLATRSAKSSAGPPERHHGRVDRKAISTSSAHKLGPAPAGVEEEIERGEGDEQSDARASAMASALLCRRTLSMCLHSIASPRASACETPRNPMSQENVKPPYATMDSLRTRNYRQRGMNRGTSGEQIATWSRRARPEDVRVCRVLVKFQ